jgi:hypothetical protein
MRMKLAPWPEPLTWLVEHQDRDVEVTVCGPGGLTLVSGLTRIGSAIDTRPGEDAPLLLLAMYGGLSLWIDFRQMLGVAFSEADELLIAFPSEVLYVLGPPHA